ncbi:hypothetical protein L484_022799 [Morus notabilis]|uniref:Uncharacterized protein n=1 Tax=Morus notabilis TaxID=981085 RepID=W9SFQ1_9ROSA|nr:hypothetical protein L484_022799 [Morus notabilis]
MNEEEEEWDPDFLDQLIHVEELALSSSSSTAFPNPNPNPNPPSHSDSLLPPPPTNHQHHQPPPLPPVTYSPPRELSKRPPPSFTPASSAALDHKDLEIQRLQKQECSELRKERNKKDGQLNNTSSTNEEKDTGLCYPKCTNSDREYEALGVGHPGISRQSPNVVSSTTSSCRAIRVQADVAGVCAEVFLNDDLPTHQDLSKKLLDIWGLPKIPTLGRNLISNLLVACQTDLHVLFGFMDMNFSVKLRMDSLVCESSASVSQYHLQSCHTLEATKVSHFYSVLTKINTGMAQLEALLKPLLDLCSVENISSYTAYISAAPVEFRKKIWRKLMLHDAVLLTFLLCNLLRENIMIEGLCSGNGVLNPCGSGASTGMDTFSVSKHRTSFTGCVPFSTKLLDAETSIEKEPWYPGFAISVSRIDWLSLFELVLQIAMRKTEEIVWQCPGVWKYLSIAQKGSWLASAETLDSAALSSIKLYLHSLVLAVLISYWWPTCPKLLFTFCSGCMEGGSAGFMNDTTEETSAFHKFTLTLQSLADCISCAGNGIEELKLRRNAIVLLAFLASSGESGFDILVSHKLPKDANFLMLILQVLVSEMDIEATAIANSPEVFKERTLLMREALILLNRLVSNPAYSATALQLLTKSRDMASLAIDIANRLSRKDQTNDQFDGMVKLIRKSEIVDLARVFKKRVFTYMGDYMS